MGSFYLKKTPDKNFSTFFSHPVGHLSYPEGYPHLQSHSLGLHAQPGSKGATNAFEFNGLNFIAANNSRTKTYAGMDGYESQFFLLFHFWWLPAVINLESKAEDLLTLSTLL